MPTVFASILVLTGLCFGAIAGFMITDFDARKVVIVIAITFIIVAVCVEIAAGMWGRR